MASDMWMLMNLQKEMTVNGENVSLEDDIYAGFLIVFKNKEEAQKEADKLDLDVVKMRFKEQDDAK